MSQTLKPLKVKEIESTLSVELKSFRRSQDPDKMAKLAVKLGDKELAYFVEVVSDVISKQIREIDIVKRDVFKNSKHAKISLTPSQKKILRAKFGLRTRRIIEDIKKQREKELQESHKIAAELRETFDLPPLKRKGRITAVRDIAGLLKKYTDDEENPIDAVKHARES